MAPQLRPIDRVGAIQASFAAWVSNRGLFSISILLSNQRPNGKPGRTDTFNALESAACRRRPSWGTNVTLTSIITSFSAGHRVMVRSRAHDCPFNQLRPASFFPDSFTSWSMQRIQRPGPRWVFRSFRFQDLEWGLACTGIRIALKSGEAVCGAGRSEGFPRALPRCLGFRRAAA